MKTKNAVGSGEKLAITLTSIEKPNPVFEYPKKGGKELSLSIAGSCGKAGHTNRFKRCVISCPLKRTVEIPYGSNDPLTFTSIAADAEFKLPSNDDDEQVSLKIQSKCWNSGGHTRRYGRCAIMCRIRPTIKYNGGENSGKLKFTSKYLNDPLPFPVPGNYTLDSDCQYMARHTSRWGGCVVRCPVKKTQGGSYHAAARLKNPRNGKFVEVKRILQYAHRGIHMYLLLQDVSKDQCSTGGAQALNDVFTPGDEIIPSFQVDDDPSADGNTFAVDRIAHYAWNRNTFLFLPSENEKTCDETVIDFTTKFPPGYGVEIDYTDKAPGGETFNVDKVHHWAWKEKTMFFFPEKSKVDDCDQTVAEFNSKL